MLMPRYRSEKNHMTDILRTSINTYNETVWHLGGVWSRCWSTDFPKEDLVGDEDEPPYVMVRSFWKTYCSQMEKTNDLVFTLKGQDRVWRIIQLGIIVWPWYIRFGVYQWSLSIHEKTQVYYTVIRNESPDTLRVSEAQGRALDFV